MPANLPYVVAFAASFTYVALKALQQLNVVHFSFRWIMPTSIGMATCEFYLVGYMVAMGPSPLSVACVGGGASLGAMLVMFFYQRERGRRAK